MAHTGMQTRFALGSIVLTTILTGCQFSTHDNQAERTDGMQASAKKAAVFQQLIIKFKPHTVTCDVDGVMRFSNSIGVPIEYVRMMSGQACVIRQFMDQEGEFAKGQILLRQHPDVEWVELDTIRKAL